MSIKIAKKVKANVIRFKMHKILGFTADKLIFIGYLLKLSKWASDNNSKMEMNDFYNKSKIVHKNRLTLYGYISEKFNLKDEDISYLEFGVSSGNSLKWWTENNKNSKSSFFAYDTFEGLPEDYGVYKSGSLTTNGVLPDIDDDRIEYKVGLFQDTLLKSIKKIDFEKQVVLHLDADIYSATIYTLSILYPYLKKGDIILFDEYGVPNHEFKVFDDFTKSFYIKLEPVGAINNYLQVAFVINDIRNN